MTADGKSGDWKSDGGDPRESALSTKEGASAAGSARTPARGNPATGNPATGAPDPIALGLRKLWADVENEAVPDEFLALLDRIDDRLDGDMSSPDSPDPAKTGGGKTA